MNRPRLFRRLAPFAIALAGLAAASCGDDDDSKDAAPDGFVAEAYMHERRIDYLRFATQSFNPSSVLNVVAHMERDRVDDSYFGPELVPEHAWDGIFDKLAALEDTRDFDGLYLLNVLLGYRDHPMLPAKLVEKVEDALIGFKFWYTEPTPEGLIDDSFYWTENHQVLFHTIEYLMGQTYPDDIFPNDGRTGREHFEHARALLLRWMDLRARLGFTEWHSNVYYQKDLTPLLTLAEYAEDEEIQTRAAMLLDMLLFDLAIHTYRGAFGVTHGRSAKKDKNTSLHDDTWGGVKLLFDQTEYPYQSTSHPDATLLARSRLYRMPEAILRIAQTEESFADRERMGIALDELGPVVSNPVAPYELSFSDPDDLPVWWGMGALTTWQVVPLTLQTMEMYDLWETELFQPFGGLRPLTANVEVAQALAVSTARYLAFGLLSEVNTYTYRTADYMLSSAVDHRKGSLLAEAHSWQATFDANALVFTTHPAVPPVESTVWRDDPEPGYWSGESSMPRSAQHENVAIHIYAAQWTADNPPPLDAFTYEPYTHAYFPQDHFDEVVQEDSWTFGRFGDGYIALFSHRPTEWIVYDPDVIATNGMVQPFDLRASGGPDNVWIVECGSREDWGTFDEFRQAVLASSVQVTEREPSDTEVFGGFDIDYDSPSVGRVTFGWTAPFIVAGTVQSTGAFPRYDNPWSQTEFNTRSTRIEYRSSGVELDFEKGQRNIF